MYCNLFIHNHYLNWCPYIREKKRYNLHKTNLYSPTAILCKYMYIPSKSEIRHARFMYIKVSKVPLWALKYMYINKIQM